MNSFFRHLPRKATAILAVIALAFTLTGCKQETPDAEEKIPAGNIQQEVHQPEADIDEAPQPEELPLTLPVQTEKPVCKATGHTAEGTCSVCGASFAFVQTANKAEKDKSKNKDKDNKKAKAFTEVLLEDKWVKAKNKTLDFAAEDEIIWEPGAEYSLPQLRINNKNSKKDLTYTVTAAGTDGEGLNGAINWQVRQNDTDVELALFTGT